MKKEDDNEPEFLEPPNINQDVVNEFTYAFDNHTYKSILSYFFDNSYLIFKASAVNSTTINIPCTALK